MSTQDENTNDAGTPENVAGDFLGQSWQILMGIRQGGADDKTNYPHGVIVGLTATPEVFIPTAHGDRPDKAIAAVHFGLWLDKHLPKFVQLWETEYAQYMNLRRMTEAKAGTPPQLALVDPSGKRLGTETTQ